MRARRLVFRASGDGVECPDCSGRGTVLQAVARRVPAAENLYDTGCDWREGTCALCDGRALLTWPELVCLVVADAIHEARQARHESLRLLAEEYSTSPAVVSGVERGRGCTCDPVGSGVDCDDSCRVRAELCARYGIPANPGRVLVEAGTWWPLP